MDGVAYRRAVAWLLSRPLVTLVDIETASARFGLSPLESAVLFRYFGPVADGIGEADENI